jgi:hypothetical protein
MIVYHQYSNHFSSHFLSLNSPNRDRRGDPP